MRPDESPTHELLLLPAPKQMKLHAGSCRVGSGGTLTVRVDDPRVMRAAQAWRSSLGKLPHPGGGCPVVIDVDHAGIPEPQGYRLSVQIDGIQLTGGSPAGCFHGLQTLQQLSRNNQAAVPCCTLRDRPDFETRGLLHDVTRGKVPTLTTLKLLADRLAHLKANQLQLYIEHAFVFSFDPDICTADNGLTPDDVRELDAYCGERFIDLVPAVATFGHMGRILSMPTYRHLAEMEASKPWSQMSWPQRTRGLTLDCTNPEAHNLVEHIWTDVLEAFSSKVVNICGDEPWDLGEGRNRRRFASGGKGEAYVDHIRRTADFLAARGRRVQFWSDVVRNYPHLFQRIPPGATILHWGYDDSADYEGTARFVEDGLDTFVCPGTSGWKRIINAMDVAQRNIATFAAAGKKHGAKGLINTDWGDHGHFNLLACSWHGIALGAALGWDAGHVTGRPFDDRFARQVLPAVGSDGIAALRALSAKMGARETWCMLTMPLRSLAEAPNLPPLDVCELQEYGGVVGNMDGWPTFSKECSRFGSGNRAATSRDAGHPADPANDAEQQDGRELQTACSFLDLFTAKVRFAHALREGQASWSRTQREREHWVEVLGVHQSAYVECWRARNKPSGLADILATLKTAALDIANIRS